MTERRMSDTEINLKFSRLEEKISDLKSTNREDFDDIHGSNADILKAVNYTNGQVAKIKERNAWISGAMWFFGAVMALFIAPFLFIEYQRLENTPTTSQVQQMIDLKLQDYIVQPEPNQNP